MFTRALSSCGRIFGLSTERPTEERRAYDRVGCEVNTTCMLAGEPRGTPLAAQVINVSPAGVCLLVAQPFSPGELLSVRVPGTTEEGASELLACVVRCDSRDHGLWELGCTFATVLAEAELQRFGAPITPSPNAAADQRSWVRYPCRAQASYQIVRSTAPGPSQSTTVLNICGGGIALEVNQPLSVGELLSVELSREGVAVLTALATVVRTTEEPNGQRLVGCNFIHELAEEQLMPLLS